MQHDEGDTPDNFPNTKNQQTANKLSRILNVEQN